MINIVFPFFVGLFLMYTSTTGNALQHGSRHYHGRYYLHEVLDFQPIINELKSATLSNIGSTILLKTTTHLSDAYMYYQLQIHPSRVTTVSLADFHVLNIPFSASWTHTQWNLSTSSEFESRLNQIESAMIKIFEVIDKTKAILIYLPHISFPSFMSKSILKLINAEADRIIIAAIEGDKFCKHNFRDVIVIPYLSTYDFFSMYGTEKEKAQIQMTSNHYSTPRKFTVIFHGNMGRLNDGQYRGILCNALQEHFGTAASFHDINVAKKKSILSIFMDTYEDMRNSRYCLVLAGDSPTSRRIFDALSTGCTPIVLGMTMNHMPYPSIADNYENRSIHIIPNSLKHWSTHKDEFLKIVIDLTDGYSESQQINSNELFMKYMAYETGAVMNSTIKAVSLLSASTGGGGGGGINLCYKLRGTFMGGNEDLYYNLTGGARNLGICAYRGDPAALIGDQALPKLLFKKTQELGKLAPLSREKVTLFAVDAGQGTTATRFVYHHVCNINIPACHFKGCCHVSNRTEMLMHDILNLYKIITGAPPLVYDIRKPKDREGEGEEMKEREKGGGRRPKYTEEQNNPYNKMIELITELVQSGVRVLTDVPIAYMLPELLQLIPDLYVLHSLRNPNVWARKRIDGHQGVDFICDTQTVLNNPSVLSYFHLLECLKANPAGVLMQSQTIDYASHHLNASLDIFAAKMAHNVATIASIVPSDHYMQLCVWAEQEYSVEKQMIEATEFIRRAEGGTTT